jgi:uncharacterized repeat protein (TIGR04076 family)
MKVDYELERHRVNFNYPNIPIFTISATLFLGTSNCFRNYSRDVVIIAREVKGTCSAGIKLGDKIIVEGPNISLEKSDPECSYTFANLMPVVFAVRPGADFDNIGFEGRLWQCEDPGPPYTEGGTVLFEVIPLEKYKEKYKSSS